MNTILAEALRRRLRFSINGDINLERLFQYSFKEVELLDSYYQQIQAKYTNVESLLGNNEMPLEDKLRCDILKYLVESLVNQETERKTAASKRRQKESIMQLMEQKQGEQLSQKSLTELQAIYDSLE